MTKSQSTKSCFELFKQWQRMSTCDHALHSLGPRIPLRWGSRETWVCNKCEAWTEVDRRGHLSWNFYDLKEYIESLREMDED